jgi:hypothetical protein
VPIRPFREIQWRDRADADEVRPPRSGVEGARQTGVQFTVEGDRQSMPCMADVDSRTITGYGNVVASSRRTDIFVVRSLAVPQVERGARIDRGNVVGTAGAFLPGFRGCISRCASTASPSIR